MRHHPFTSSLLLWLVAAALAPPGSYAQSACPSSITQATWQGSATSNNWILPLNWGLGGLNCYPDNAATSVSILSATSPTVLLKNAVNIDNLTIGSADALNIRGGGSLYVYGTAISNAGMLNIQGDSGGNGVLSINNDATLSGGGAVTLSSATGGGVAYLSQSGQLFHTLTNAENTIEGNGSIGLGGLKIVNQGVIDATTASGELATLTLTGGGTITNSGLMEATTGTLVDFNPIVNTGGNITANGGTVEFGDAGAGLTAAVVTGGTLNSLNGGTLETAPGEVATLNGVTISHGSTYTAPDNSFTHLRGTITNYGTVAVSGGGGHNSTINLDTDVTLAGGGTVTLATNPTGGGVALIQENGAAGSPIVTLTNVDNVIRGNGIIGSGGMNLTNGAQGVIDATKASGELGTLTVTGGGTVTNQGRMEATQGATLAIQNPLVNDANAAITAAAGSTLQLTGGRTIVNQGLIQETAGTLLIQDPVANAGGIISAVGGLAQVNGTITGGTLDEQSGGTMATLYSATLNGVTLSSGSTYTASNGASTHLQGTITNRGNIEAVGGGGPSGSLYIDDDVTLSGGGAVTLSSATGGGEAYLLQSGGVFHTLTNADNTIEGNGSIGLGGLKIVNQGVIDATTASGELGTLTLTGGGTITNSGLMEATTGNLVDFNPIVNTGGNITANGGTVEFGDAGAGLTAAVVTGGTLNSLNGGTLETAPGEVATLNGVTISHGSTYTAPDNSFTHIQGTITNEGTVAVSGGGGHNSTVNLDTDVTLAGGGTVTLATNPTGGGVALIQQNGAAGSPIVTLTNVGNVIQGNGVIGSGGLKVVNQAGGTFEATTGSGQTTTLEIEGGGTVTNTGTLGADTGATLLVANPLSSSTYTTGTLHTGTYTANGTIQLNQLGTTGGEILTNEATINLDGSNSGAAAIVDAAGRSALSALATNQGTFTLHDGGNANFTTRSDFQNSGTVYVDAASALTTGAGGSHTYTQSGGTTTVNGTLTASTIAVNGGLLDGTGTLVGAVTVGPTATLQPGDAPGTITVSGSLALDGSLAEAIDSASSFNVLDITGTPGSLTLGSTSTLDLLLGAGYDPTAGTSFAIANFTSLSGTFGSIENDTFNGGSERWNVLYNPNDIILTAENVVTGPTTVNATWSAGTPASWTTAATWACAPGPSSCVPDNGAPASTVYDVNIDNPASGATMTQTGAETVNTLTLTAGTLDIAPGASLNLAAQPNGISDIPHGAGLSLEGSFTAGSVSALAGLSSIEGSLNLDNGQTTSVSPAAGTLAIAGTGHLNASTSSTSLAVNGNVSNAGSVRVGYGASLSSTGTYGQSEGSTDVAGTLSAAAVNIEGGTLSGDGALEGTVTLGSGATLHPGEVSTPGVLTVEGDATLSAADFIETLGGPSPGKGYGVFDVSGDLSLSSAELSLVGLNGFVPTDGQMFDIANAGSISGTFSDGTLAYAGGMFTVDYADSGCVSGYADCVDLTWRSGGTGSVPEPPGLMLFAMGLLSLAWTFRQRVRRAGIQRCPQSAI